jgi:hypothetical protein
MRAIFVTVLMFPVLLLALTPSESGEREATDATAASVSKTDEDGGFVLPPGFKARKRGKFIVYCRKEAVMGTRFPAEKCYDETGIREMLRSQLEDRQRVDQMRRICGNREACGSN